MRLGVICRTLGVLCVLFCATLLPPIGISLAYMDGESGRFAAAGSIALLAGLVFWLPFRRKHVNVRSRDGFLIVGVMWTAMSALGAVPFMLTLGVSFADAFFESAAGYTTTKGSRSSARTTPPISCATLRPSAWLGAICSHLTKG